MKEKSTSNLNLDALPQDLANRMIDGLRKEPNDVVELQVGDWTKPTRNGRYYPPDVMANAIREYQRNKNSNSSLEGDTTHPGVHFMSTPKANTETAFKIINQLIKEQGISGFGYRQVMMTLSNNWLSGKTGNHLDLPVVDLRPWLSQFKPDGRTEGAEWLETMGLWGRSRRLAGRMSFIDRFLAGPRMGVVSESQTENLNDRSPLGCISGPPNLVRIRQENVRKMKPISGNRFALPIRFRFKPGKGFMRAIGRLVKSGKAEIRDFHWSEPNDHDDNRWKVVDVKFGKNATELIIETDMVMPLGAEVHIPWSFTHNNPNTDTLFFVKYWK